MNNEEFSNAFDTALNSYSLQAEFGEGTSKYNITLMNTRNQYFLQRLNMKYLLICIMVRIYMETSLKVLKS